MARVVHEFYAHLRALSLQTGPTQPLGDPGKLDGLHTARVHDGGAAAVGGREEAVFNLRFSEHWLCATRKKKLIEAVVLDA